MVFRTPIETPRLVLNKESMRDFDRFYTMSIDPEVMRFIGDGSVFHWTKEVALKKFKDRIAAQDRNAFGNLAVYRKDRGLYIGWCGVSHSKFLGHIELGYRYCRDAWSKGYATETAAAILDEAFRATDVEEIQACVHPENRASIRVLEKLGFCYAFQKLSKPICRDIPVYTIDRAGFAARPG